MTTNNTLTRGQAIVMAEMRRLAGLGVSDVSGGELNSSLVEQSLAAASNPSAHRRASELVALGLLEHGTPRPCKISGRSVATYRLPTARRAGRVIDLVAHLAGTGSTSATMEVATEEHRIFDLLAAW